MTATPSGRPTISAVPEEFKDNSGNHEDNRTKEDEIAGLSVSNQIVVTFLLPSNPPIADMFSDQNTKQSSSGNGGSLDFDNLIEFAFPVRMNSFWQDIKASDKFNLSSVKFTPAKSKVSLTFFRDGRPVGLSDSERTAVNMLMDIPFREGKISEAKSDGEQQFASILLNDWVLETHENPIEHFQFQRSRLSLCSK